MLQRFCSNIITAIRIAVPIMANLIYLAVKAILRLVNMILVIMILRNHVTYLLCEAPAHLEVANLLLSLIGSTDCGLTGGGALALTSSLPLDGSASPDSLVLTGLAGSGVRISG